MQTDKSGQEKKAMQLRVLSFNSAYGSCPGKPESFSMEERMVKKGGSHSYPQGSMGGEHFLFALRVHTA